MPAGVLKRYDPPGCDPAITQAIYNAYAPIFANCAGNPTCEALVYSQYIAAVTTACGPGGGG